MNADSGERGWRGVENIVEDDDRRGRSSFRQFPDTPKGLCRILRARGPKQLSYDSHSTLRMQKQHRHRFTTD